MRLIMVLTGCLWLAGCPLRPISLPSMGSPEPDPEPVLVSEQPVPAPLMTWLAVLEKTLSLEPEQAQQRLTPLNLDAGSLVVFHQVLLNQRLGERESWIWARDRLRQLLKQNHPPGVRPLLQLLLEHNQAMINAAQREANLQGKLQEVRGERDRLREKILALTNLERRLDDRKEQDADAATRPEGTTEE